MGVLKERSLSELPARLPFPTGRASRLWLVRADASSRTLADCLDPDERRRADTLVSHVDRDRYVTAHVALRLLSGAYLGLTPAAIPIGRAPCQACGEFHGRPIIRESRLHFSISHRTDRALIAFAAVPVGVDLEATPNEDTVRDALPILHPREIAEISALSERDRPAAFARVWTRKEAYLKGLGVGLSHGAAIDYVGAAEQPQPRPGWRIEDVPISKDFAAAVALWTATSTMDSAHPGPSA